MNLLLTGGHSGIGLELTKRLLQEGHHIGLILRNEGRKREAIEALGTSENIDFFYADLSKRDEVLAVAADIQSKWNSIDGLFNNAGVLMDKAVYSEQGNEMQFEVNALTPYFLTQALKPLLDAAEQPFVINTATGNMHKQKSLDIENLKRPKKFVKLLGSYLNSKFAMVQLMNHLESQWSNVRIVHVDPGPNKTKMTSGSGMPGWLLPIRNLVFPKATKGAGKVYDAAFSSDFASKSGVYITGGKVKSITSRLTADQVQEMTH